MRRSANGFTLVELLIALLLVSLLSALSYLLVNQLSLTERQIEAENAALKDIQKVVWERELLQSVSYTPGLPEQDVQHTGRLYIPEQVSDNQQGAQGAPLIEFVTLHTPDRQLSKQSYWLDQTTLYRRNTRLDYAAGNENSLFETDDDSTRTPLINNVTSASFAALGADNSEGSQFLPSQGVESVLEHGTFGQIRRVFFLGLPPGALPELKIAELSGVLQGAGGSSSGTQVGGFTGTNNNDDEDSESEENETPPPPPRPVCSDPFAGIEEC